MASIFQFKQFAVDQADCAMKINTDGVLLAALVSLDQVDTVLDVGTGTGVIALMLAQRHADAYIDAVEMDQLAANRAKNNFQNAIFRDRLNLFACAFQELHTDKHYDLIISNPPFYTNSLHNPDARKKLARHTDHAFFQQLLTFSAQQLTSCGKLTLILPPALADLLIGEALSLGLILKKETHIRSFEQESIIRKIVVFEKNYPGDVELSDFVIYKEKGVYSDAYKQLLQPYFLAF